MSGKNSGLTKVPRTERPHRYDQQWEFKEGDVREAFQRVYSPNANYVLFQTIANQEAVDVLSRYGAYRENTDSPRKIKKISLSDESSQRVQFDNNLMDSYQRAIDKIALKKIGNKQYSDYPMVTTKGVHNINRDPNAIFWPRVYIVNAKSERELKAIIDGLSGEESLKVLEELESPHFYRIAKIEKLCESKIAPLVRLPQELRFGAQELSMCVDFFAQPTEKLISLECTIDDG